MRPAMMTRALTRGAVLAATFSILASAVTYGATWTDPTDYAPGATVTIRGGNDANGSPGYVPGNTVEVTVTGPNGAASPDNPDGWSDECSAVVVDDASASWSCNVTLSADPAVSAGTYSYVAVSMTLDGRTITEPGTFTDTVNTTVTLVISPSYPVDGGASARPRGHRGR